MARLWHEGLWRPARDIPFLVFSVAVAASLIRSIDQPSADLGIAGTEVSLVPADIALAALAALAALRLLGRASLPRPARAVTYAAAAFAAWLMISSAANGPDAVVGGVKLLEYGLLGVGAILFVQRRMQLWLLVGLLVAITIAAVIYAILDFFGLPLGPLPHRGGPGRRQPSFMGEHDFAALATLALSFGLAALYVQKHRLRKLPFVAIVAGSIGVLLGATVAGLIGFYLGVGAIVGLAAIRGAVNRRALAVTALVAVVVTAGVVSLRYGDLGSVLRYLGIQEAGEGPGQFAGSFSQRVIYAYIGGRIFLDNPIIGTGWHGELPAEEYARYLPDARARFPDQPTNYFPAADGTFIPQQTYDQILFQLGIVGAALFLVLAALTVRTALGVGRDWPRGDIDETASYLPAAWVGVLAASLAGAALFGGIPQTAIFWLTLGIAALSPSLVPPAAVIPRPVEQPELTAAAR